MATLIRPQVHVPACPTASGRRRSGCHFACTCVLLACETPAAEKEAQRADPDAAVGTAGTEADFDSGADLEVDAASSGVHSADEGRASGSAVSAQSRPDAIWPDTASEDEDACWWALVEQGRGCDAETVVERIVDGHMW